MRATEHHPATPKETARLHEKIHLHNVETAFFAAMENADTTIDKEAVIAYLETLKAGIDAEKEALKDQKDALGDQKELLAEALERIRDFILDPPTGKKAQEKKDELIQDAEEILEEPEQPHSGCNLNYF